MTDRVYERSDPALTEKQVIEVVACQTLYDEAQLRPDCNFEGDLGIDSIILESIVATVSERFGLSVGLAGELSTIRELAEAVDRALGDTSETATSLPMPVEHPAARWSSEEERGDTVLEIVLSAAVRQTQYPRERLDPDADLESELGVDSVILTSIIDEAAETLGLGLVAPDAFSATTLRVLSEELHGTRAGNGDSVAPSTAASLTPIVDTVDTEDEWDARSMKDFGEERSPDIFAKTRSFNSYLRGREEQQLYWYGMPLYSRCENRAVIFDEHAGRKREFLMFAANNYLGLANHPKVVEAVCEATRTYGATHTGSRFIGGTNMLHRELERRLAAFKQRPSCIVYPGGYSANIGAISALVKSYDTVVVDKLNHMSIVDGVRLSGGTRRIYQHNDMADLERILRRSSQETAGGKLIVADGVFSMHGDVCDLPGILRLAEMYGARVMIDDAHATGVLGVRGTGTAEHFGRKGEVDLELGTMSKTLAGMGGFVVGEEEVVEYLRYYSNSYTFAANIPAGVAAGLIASIDVIEAEPERISRLWENIGTLRQNLLAAGFNLENSESAILPIVIGDDRKTMEMGRAVRARGLFCQTVVYPGVSLGDARLRVSVTSEHTKEDLELATEIFVDSARAAGVLLTAE